MIEDEQPGLRLAGELGELGLSSCGTARRIAGTCWLVRHQLQAAVPATLPYSLRESARRSHGTLDRRWVGLVSPEITMLRSAVSKR